MNTDEIFEVLEIEPTTDSTVIRKAYAALVRKYHPEEYPEEWQRIHEAYEIALGNARNSGYRKVQPKDWIAQTDFCDQATLPANKGEEKTEDDEDVEEWIDTESFFQERQRGQKEGGQIAKAEVYTFFHNSSRSQLNCYERWKKFLKSPALASVCMEEGVLNEFAGLLKLVKPATKICRLLETYFEKIRYEIDNTPHSESKQEKLLLVRGIENELNRIVEWRKKRREIAVFCFIAGFSFLYMFGETGKHAGNIKEETVNINGTVLPKHVEIMAEERMRGARLGEPFADSENVIVLYLNRNYGTIEGEKYSYHRVFGNAKYKISESKVPRARDASFVAYIGIITMDGTADDVVLCMSLEEFGIENEEIFVYKYEAKKREYVEQQVSYPTNDALLVSFPYVYDNVLYMKMRENYTADQSVISNDLDGIVVVGVEK